MQIHDEGEKPCDDATCWQNVTKYLIKFQGTSEGLFPAYPSVNVLLWSFISSFTGERPPYLIQRLNPSEVEKCLQSGDSVVMF